MNMEPENHPIEKAYHLLNRYSNLFLGFHVFFPGCIHVSSFFPRHISIWKIKFVIKIRGQ